LACDRLFGRSDLSRFGEDTGHDAAPKFFVRFATAASLALPMQSRADAGEKIVEDVDFATLCSPTVLHHNSSTR
jgi:hypothetical protein